MYNKVILVGNLTRDIELKYLQGGVAIAKSAVATSRKFKSNTGEQKEEVCFTDITFFARSAEVANQYLHKGSKVLVEGRLVFDQWTDQNGQKRSKHSVAVETMQMLDSKATAEQVHTSSQQSDTTQNTNKPQQQDSQPTYAQPNKQQPAYDEKTMSDIDEMEEESPF